MLNLSENNWDNVIVKTMQYTYSQNEFLPLYRMDTANYVRIMYDTLSERNFKFPRIWDVIFPFCCHLSKSARKFFIIQFLIAFISLIRW
jgi:hypothetical protein